MGFNLDTWIDTIQDYSNKAEELVVEAAESQHDFIVDRNRDNLRVAGEDSRSRKIVPDYSRRTREIKRRKGQPSDRVTLRDTGAFHASIFADFQGDEIRINATDSKTGKLTQKYGSSVLGLQDDDVAELTNRVRPDFIAGFRKKMLG